MSYEVWTTAVYVRALFLSGATLKTWNIFIQCPDNSKWPSPSAPTNDQPKPVYIPPIFFNYRKSPQILYERDCTHADGYIDILWGLCLIKSIWWKTECAIREKVQFQNHVVTHLHNVSCFLKACFIHSKKNRSGELQVDLADSYSQHHCIYHEHGKIKCGFHYDATIKAVALPWLYFGFCNRKLKHCIYFFSVADNRRV